MKTQITLPPFLEGRCTLNAYVDWVTRKAVAHYKRDRKRGNLTLIYDAVLQAIHAAIVDSNGNDAYTGKPLRWDLIGTYCNKDSKEGRRSYKKLFCDLPTVDHVDDGMGAPNFKVCAWRTNDCKSDLSYGEFVDMCRSVIAHVDRKMSPKRAA